MLAAQFIRKNPQAKSLRKQWDEAYRRPFEVGKEDERDVQKRSSS